MSVNKIISEVNKAVVGKEECVSKIMMAILAKGHILLEDIPGVGKTTLAKAFSSALGLTSKRMQFTPDVLPSDIVGFMVPEASSHNFVLHKGAIFCNLFLADEINRTSSRTQSALLEVMEENQISVDGETFEAYKPFNVIATQNPFGSAGTQRLPESQVDRFMICLSLGYLNQDDEVELLKRKEKKEEYKVNTVSSIDALLTMQKEVENIYVNDAIMEYAVRLIRKSREHEHIALGASPRGAIALISMAKANAYIQNRTYVIPKDIQDVFYDVINHRIVLKNEERNANQRKQEIIHGILNSIYPPNLGKDGY